MIPPNEINDSNEKSQKNLTEKIWYNDIQNFISYNNYFIILPLQHMTHEERLNALVRFFMYLGIILSLIRADYRYLLLGIVAAIISILLDQHSKKQKEKIQNLLKKQNMSIVDNKICSSSTVQNPFMNPNIADIVYNPNRPSACSIENDDVKEIVSKNFTEHLFQDVSDIYGKYASQRQFYTVASTTIPNDQNGFAKWCYGRDYSCKEGNGKQCLENISSNAISSISKGGAR